MEVFGIADEIGPSHVVHLREPSLALEAVLVIDNVSAGPAIGGLRMAPDVDAEECVRLARAMTFKSAAAGLRHGGAKAVIRADPAVPPADKEALIRAFACLIRDFEDYVVGPDMGTDETCMAWIHDEIGRSVGLPRELGGIPLDEIGATGFGLAAALDVAADFCDVRPEGARFVVQGFGAVGLHVSRFLAQRGAVLVGVADHAGTLADPDGIDVDALADLKQAGGQVTDAPFGTKLDRDAVVDLECDVWIPAARPDVITVDNVDRLRTRLVAEGANIPVTPDAEAVLHERGVLVLPDFIANAGGVICASVEYQGGTERQALATIEERVAQNTRTVLGLAREHGVPPRIAATRMALDRVRRASSFRRW